MSFLYRSLLLVFSLTALAVSPPAAAQSTGTIAGQVTDADDTPLEGVNVLVEGTTRGAATGPNGRFRIDDVPTGEPTVVARFVGFRTARRTVTVSAGETARVTFVLQPDAVGMRGIQVTALRPNLEPSGQLKSPQIRKAEVADPGALLRDLPGVSSVRRGPMGLDPNVRGLVESEVGVYIGGMRTFPAGPARMDSPMSHVDPSTIASIDVVKGPYALTWGPGNMSAIRVEQRGEDPPPVPLTGSVHTGYDTNEQSVETTAFAMGRQGRWFYSANGAWRTGDDYDAGNGETVPGDYESAEGRGRLGVKLSDRSTLSITGSYQDQQDLDYPGRLLNAAFFRTGMGQLNYAYARDTGTLRSFDVRLSAQQTLHEMDNRGKPTFEAGTLPNGMTRPPLRIGVASEIQNVSGRVAADLALGDGWDVKVGGDVLHTFRDAARLLRAAPPGREPFVPPFYKTDDGEVLDNLWPGVTITQEGAFVNATRTVGTVTLSGTTRLDLAQADANDPTGPFLANANATDDDLSQNDAMLSGSVTASIPLSQRWTLSLGAGSVARPPSALERYADRFPTSKAQTSAEFQGVPTLDPERSTQGDVWLEGTGDRWTLRVSGFVRSIDDYITLEPTNLSPILPLSPPTVFRYRNGEATFVGSEASGALSLSDPLSVRASGTWLWGEDDTLDEPAFGISPPSARVGLRWSPSISAAALSTLYLDGSVQLTAEQDRVAASRNERVTDGYTTVDLRAGVLVMNRVEVKVGVDNLFDVSYTNHLNASNPFTGARVPEPGRVFTTNLTVQF
jgi:iron complex outermembrane receptor protein